MQQQLQRLFDIKKTQLELVSDRGYEISAEEAPILNMDIDGFITYITPLANANPKAPLRSLLSRLYVGRLPDGKTKNMLVYYGGKVSQQQKQVSADVVREFIGNVSKYKVAEAILIVDAPLSSTGESELSSLTLTKWQVFDGGELTYNTTRHIDTPRHELLPQAEVPEKLRELKVDLSKLSILRLTDPVVKYYGWSAGGVVRIHRNDTVVSVLTPKSINYKVITS